MRSILKYLMFPCVCLPVLAACSQDGLQEEGRGYLSARIYEDSSMEVKIPELKSGETAEDIVFGLTVFDAFENQVAQVVDCRTLESAPLELRVGNYTGVASSAVSGPAAFDAPFYSGSAEFSISADEVTNIDITATVANTRVTVEYSDEIPANFLSYDFTVTNGQGQLVFSTGDCTPSEEGKYVSRDGYFSVTGTLSWTLSLVNNDGQKYQDLTGTVSDVKAAEHYRFSWTLAHEPDNIGAGAITVILDDSMNEKEYDLVLDPDDATVPVISENFETSDIISVEIGESVSRILSVSSADGFSSLLLTYPDPSALTPVKVELTGASEETLSALSAIGIGVSSAAGAVDSVAVDLTSFLPSLPIGTYQMALMAVDRGNTYSEKTYDFEVISDLDAEAMAVNAWALFADVQGRWFSQSQPEGLSFQYKKTADADWTDFSGEIIADAATRTYTARFLNLEPETEYVFRAVSAEDKETKELTFTTESAGVIHNMSLDAWWMNGSAPMPNESGDYEIWDSANRGTSDYGYTPTTQEQTLVAVPGAGKSAAKLESQLATILIVSKFAAGNLYTGKYQNTIMNISNPGAELDWGVPFTSRPLALKGFYMYKPQTVDQGDYNGMSGKMDICQIQVFLTDWDAPFRVNTASQTFVDVTNNPGIIAYGSLESDVTMDEYDDFTIRLEYRDLTRTPKYVVIVAAASKYGDYFTGGVGSVLYVDEFSFVYDPSDLATPPEMTVGR